MKRLNKVHFIRLTRVYDNTVVIVNAEKIQQITKREKGSGALIFFDGEEGGLAVLDDREEIMRQCEKQKERKK